jgi:hypothetical protein
MGMAFSPRFLAACSLTLVNPDLPPLPLATPRPRQSPSKKFQNEETANLNRQPHPKTARTRHIRWIFNSL